ncbi:hypothetical protein ACFFMN_23800 [Planobispora siamensis]|uniref:Uncharacterized protein n=1 Tax=Planobispora siamensis TaxID=936338 RepID=A0A8J3WLJ8_9ACTN|nr:hypothetical protein [Planobispora siamensis]GIH95374.1 hypothetical protein Psi01_60040 [Planobispora siamensis]
MHDTPWFETDAAIACVDLIGRSGATNFEFGYLHDDVPMEEAAWYAHAQYRGARITAQGHRDPIAAMEELARKVLAGGLCTGCQCTVSLSDDGAGLCRWRRMGPRWEMGCKITPPPSPKKRRRAKKKRGGKRRA